MFKNSLTKFKRIFCSIGNYLPTFFRLRSQAAVIADMAGSRYSSKRQPPGILKTAMALLRPQVATRGAGNISLSATIWVNFFIGIVYIICERKSSAPHLEK